MGLDLASSLNHWRLVHRRTDLSRRAPPDSLPASTRFSIVCISAGVSRNLSDRAGPGRASARSKKKSAALSSAALRRRT